MGTEVFWIRLFCSEFDDARWLAIEQLPDADAVQLIYVRMLMLAGRSNAGGLLLLHESLPYDVATLAAVLRRTTPVVQYALKTLERFRYIEVLDGVIAITAWDRLQPTDELARLAERREKDKLRKRLERAGKRSKLLGASADESTDSPWKSGTTNIESKSITTTTISQHGKNVVAGAEELEEVLAMVPLQERSKRLQTVVADAVMRQGKEVAASNIRYGLANHDPHKGRLGGMICAAIKGDFACAARDEARAEDDARATARVRQENAEATRKELEEREQRESLAQQAIWLSLPPEDQTELARQAREKFTCLPEPASPLESVLNDTTVPIIKILAAMYANGELVLPASRGTTCFVGVNK